MTAFRSRIPVVGSKLVAGVAALCVFFLAPLPAAVAASVDMGDRPGAGTSSDSVGWPFLGFDAARTGYNPFEHALSPANVADLAVDWSRALGPEGGGSPVLTRHGTLIVRGGDYRLWGVDASTGARRWRTPFEVYASAAGVAQGLAYIGDIGGVMRAVNGATGAVVWKSHSGTGGQQIDTAPVVANGLVYLGLNDPEVLAMNASTGALAWASRARTCYIGLSSPAVVDGVDYTGDDCGNLWALDASTGRVQWHVSASTTGSTFTPAVGGRLVYATAGSDLGAFDPSTGARVWAASLGSPGASSSPAVARGIVYATSGDGTINAFHARSGLQLWTASTGSRKSSWLAIANGVLYVASDKLYAFDAASGARLLSKRIGATDYLSAPVVANGEVYVDGSDGRLYALRP